MASGNLRKMKVSPGDTVQYHLVTGDELTHLNPLLGKRLLIRYEGLINCVACGRKTKKSYGQGYCYPCSQNLAECDICIVRPEKCHYAAGTCRQPQWGEEYCMQWHYVYLSNTSGLKVGITRHTQVPTRWIDQGATQALAMMRVDTRYHSGLLEILFKEHVNDKTDWRRMLKGEPEPMDLVAERKRLLSECEVQLKALHMEFGKEGVEIMQDAPVYHFNYPVLEYPEKVSSYNLDKTPRIEARLMGIKGQYLIFDGGVINMRKYGGYHIDFEVLGD